MTCHTRLEAHKALEKLMALELSRAHGHISELHMEKRALERPMERNFGINLDDTLDTHLANRKVMLLPMYKAIRYYMTLDLSVLAARKEANPRVLRGLDPPTGSEA